MHEPAQRPGAAPELTEPAKGRDGSTGGGAPMPSLTALQRSVGNAAVAAYLATRTPVVQRDGGWHPPMAGPPLPQTALRELIATRPLAELPRVERALQDAVARAGTTSRTTLVRVGTDSYEVTSDAFGDLMRLVSVRIERTAVEEAITELLTTTSRRAGDTAAQRASVAVNNALHTALGASPGVDRLIRFELPGIPGSWEILSGDIEGLAAHTERVFRLIDRRNETDSQIAAGEILFATARLAIDMTPILGNLVAAGSLAARALGPDPRDRPSAGEYALAGASVLLEALAIGGFFRAAGRVVRGTAELVAASRTLAETAGLPRAPALRLARILLAMGEGERAAITAMGRRVRLGGHLRPSQVATARELLGTVGRAAPETERAVTSASGRELAHGAPMSNPPSHTAGPQSPPPAPVGAMSAGAMSAVPGVGELEAGAADLALEARRLLYRLPNPTTAVEERVRMRLQEVLDSAPRLAREAREMAPHERMTPGERARSDAVMQRLRGVVWRTERRLAQLAEQSLGVSGHDALWRRYRDVLRTDPVLAAEVAALPGDAALPAALAADPALRTRLQGLARRLATAAEGGISRAIEEARSLRLPSQMRGSHRWAVAADGREVLSGNPAPHLPGGETGAGEDLIARFGIADVDPNHAEVKLIAEAVDVFAVSGVVCEQCRNFLRAMARRWQRPIVVCDPEAVLVFHPTREPRVIPH
ncbi:hypothetical protein Afil01_32520 [Actinorhabdospora filicis]|uniref:Uncharacterized protein n=1 Tax=Actinorhabdospora filicis TaxID=1785913 RepID=A0A9W6SK10_9ACTN|nr:hypothetical protein [Actinorhabdospora filicis]GLZ78445.1 hypothetical protein Afil01_32520 [Actinorhabdospora filicis]